MRIDPDFDVLDCVSRTRIEPLQRVEIPRIFTGIRWIRNDGIPGLGKIPLLESRPPILDVGPQLAGTFGGR